MKHTIQLMSHNEAAIRNRDVAIALHSLLELVFSNRSELLQMSPDDRSLKPTSHSVRNKLSAASCRKILLTKISLLFSVELFRFS